MTPRTWKIFAILELFIILLLVAAWAFALPFALKKAKKSTLRSLYERNAPPLRIEENGVLYSPIILDLTVDSGFTRHHVNGQYMDEARPLALIRQMNSWDFQPLLVRPNKDVSFDALIHTLVGLKGSGVKIMQVFATSNHVLALTERNLEREVDNLLPAAPEN